jgi:hypothetical protein
MPSKAAAGLLFVLISTFLAPAFAQRASGGATMPSATGNQFYSGKVALDDGGAIPFNKVTIESSCGGNIRQETTASAKGTFGFTLGRGSGDINLETTNTANRAGASSAVIDPTTCVISAKLTGYYSDIVYLANLDKGRPDLGTIILHKAAPVAPGSVSALSAKAPKDARKAFEKGADAMKNRKFEEAIKNYQKAVDAYPSYAEALFEIGRAQLALNKPDEARKSFEASVKEDAKYTPPLRQLAEFENKAKNWKGMVEYTTRILEIAPGALPDIYQADSMARYRMQDFDGAEKSAREGVKADVQRRYPKLYQLSAFALSAKGQPGAAAEQLKLYLQYADNPPDAAAMKTQIAEFEKTAAAAPKP